MVIKNLRKPTSFAEIGVGQVFMDVDHEYAWCMRISEVENVDGNKRNTVILCDGELTWNDPNDAVVPVAAELVVR